MTPQSPSFCCTPHHNTCTRTASWWPHLPQSLQLPQHRPPTPLFSSSVVPFAPSNRLSLLRHHLCHLHLLQSTISEFDKDYSRYRGDGDDDDDYGARSQFGTKSYWDAMYQGMGDFSPDEYSWYYGFDVIKPHLLEHVGSPSKNSDEESPSILIPGCGNDPLLLDLYNFGYRHITAFDYSSGAIKRQQSLLEYLPPSEDIDDVQLSVQDARSLPHEWTNSFDVLIEKGALDAIYLSGDGNFEKSVEELSRVIRKGGIFFSISGVVPEELRREWLKEEEWEWLRDGSGDLKAGCFVWMKR